MYSFKDIIDDIERNLDKKIDVSELASKAGMSVYEFRRIFTFVAGISFAEYVRKRRLSVSALELYEGKSSITDLALKYGYESPSSFSRAFKDFHGFSPSEAKSKNDFKLFTKIGTEIVAKGGKDVVYSVFHKEAFSVYGFEGLSDMTDTECCENVWEDFYSSGLSEDLCKSEELYAVYVNGNDTVKCVIGTLDENCGEKVDIPESDWVSFKLYTTDDAYVNKFYNDIITGWLESSGYKKRDDVPNIEIFPSDMSDDGFEWKICVAVRSEKSAD